MQPAPRTNPNRSSKPQITDNYRSIGPAAIMAALICMPKKRSKHAQPAASHMN